MRKSQQGDIPYHFTDDFLFQSQTSGQASWKSCPESWTPDANAGALAHTCPCRRHDCLPYGYKMNFLFDSMLLVFFLWLFIINDITKFIKRIEIICSKCTQKSIRA